MASTPNYRLLAVKLGDLLKYDVVDKEIGRIGGAIIGGSTNSFPNESITSIRAQHIYNWVCTLAQRKMTSESRNDLLVTFVRNLTPLEHRNAADAILIEAGLPPVLINRENYKLFLQREFHPEVFRHARTLFVQGHYFHSVFEAAKAYHESVKTKALLSTNPIHGQSLMQLVWGEKNGVLRINKGETPTERNEQLGIMQLATGLIAAIRNPTAHEPALSWPIRREEALELLSFISYLFRQLEKSVYVPRT